MAIQISGTTVIDNSRNFSSIESISGNGVATQAEAEAGTNNDQIMTPLRVKQAIEATSGGGGVDDDINWSGCNVGCTVRGGGNVIYKSGGIIWIVAPSSSQDGSTWPLGYCNGSGGASPNQAQRITGRSGWFIPDLGMLQTSYNCRAYWDTYCGCVYWSSTGCYSISAHNLCFANGTYSNRQTNGGGCVRTMRVICY
jgi:hypothetical protein